ncbi:MAG TPA: glycoside hydrolase family 15 protein [Candidatus Saccharimonadales bacterium]|nr:glycoside hydrolase family 15 protein [Candidatus Saccharimonadales bacterium]
MTRPILLSNGTLHVGLNLYGMVHDLFYPWVGFENHARAQNMRHRIGVWTPKEFSWLDDGNWEFRMQYHEHAQIGHTTARNKKLGITLQFDDCVDSDENVFVRNIHLINASAEKREIRLFLHQMLMISSSLNGDTAQFLPNEPAILHFKGRRNFVFGAKDQLGKPFTAHAIGIFGDKEHEGTFRDAEDGELNQNNVDFGRVDSVLGFTAELMPYESTRFDYWMAAGKSQWEAIALHRKVMSAGVQPFLEHTARHWHRFLSTAEKTIQQFAKPLQAPFRNSLMVLMSQIDHNGAVIASTDTTMLNYRKDSYVYSWPRDASYAIWPLVRLGYRKEPKKFFEFCQKAIHPEGYLLQKFRPDYAVGSTWHPYTISGRIVPPIQEDETAIVVFLLGEYITHTKDKETLEKYYDTLVLPAANFMASYIDEATKLPHASYDLWEEKFLTTTYTTALVYAALNSAIKMAERLRRPKDAVRWQMVAEEMYTAAQNILYNKERKFFYKGFLNEGKKGLVYDDTVDISSFYGAYMFGLFSVNSKAMSDSLKTIERIYHFRPGQPTAAQRYENDQYYTTDPAGMGNPWFITSLWVAEYDMQTGNVDRAEATLQWVRDCMLRSGVLSEQVNPITYKFTSVAPLAWSQAEFLSCILDLAAIKANADAKE